MKPPEELTILVSQKLMLCYPGLIGWQARAALTSRLSQADSTFSTNELVGTKDNN